MKASEIPSMTSCGVVARCESNWGKDATIRMTPSALPTAANATRRLIFRNPLTNSSILRKYGPVFLQEHERLHE